MNLLYLILPIVVGAFFIWYGLMWLLRPNKMYDFFDRHPLLYPPMPGDRKEYRESKEGKFRCRFGAIGAVFVGIVFIIASISLMMK
jgi:hypothetical protein